MIGKQMEIYSKKSNLIEGLNESRKQSSVFNKTQNSSCPESAGKALSHANTEQKRKTDDACRPAEKQKENAAFTHTEKYKQKGAENGCRRTRKRKQGNISQALQGLRHRRALQSRHGKKIKKRCGRNGQKRVKVF